MEITHKMNKIRNNDSQTAEYGGLNARFLAMVDGLPLQLTYEKAAFLCSCSKAQIQRGIQAGDLALGTTPGGKSKRSKRILTASVLEWIGGRRK
jgi:hypothetical protein